MQWPPWQFANPAQVLWALQGAYTFLLIFELFYIGVLAHAILLENEVMGQGCSDLWLLLETKVGLLWLKALFFSHS